MLREHKEARGSRLAEAPCLEVSMFVRRYSAEAKVGPITFEVRDGEFFSLLGPSGCGKTTTLRAIAGFERVDEGEIRLRGQAVHHTPPNKRGIGLVFQRHALFPHLTVWENVAFGLKQHKVSSTVAAERIRSMLELVSLNGYEDRWPSQLSGGQQQRVALARSLALEPPLLLLDEPMSSLDLKLRVQMREELRKLQKRLRQTTVFVTHDQTEALAMSDRIAVLSNGQIEQVGTPWEIYNRPASRFVAGFIGASNQLQVAVSLQNGAGLVGTTKEGLQLVLPRHLAPAHREAVAIVRPEAVHLYTDGHVDGENVFAATVIDHEYLGDDTQLRVLAESGVELTVTRKSLPSDGAALTGRKCHVKIDPESIYLIG